MTSRQGHRQGSGARYQRPDAPFQAQVEDDQGQPQEKKDDAAVDHPSSFIRSWR